MHAGIHSAATERHSGAAAHHRPDPLHPEGSALSGVVRFPWQQRTGARDEQVPHDEVQLSLPQDARASGCGTGMMGYCP